jgi:hypothetical protein
LPRRSKMHCFADLVWVNTIVSKKLGHGTMVEYIETHGWTIKKTPDKRESLPCSIWRLRRHCLPNMSMHDMCPWQKSSCYDRVSMKIARQRHLEASLHRQAQCLLSQEEQF